MFSSANAKWFALYAVVLAVTIIAAFVIIVTTGNSTPALGLVRSFAPAVPILVGIVGLFKNLGVIQKQTNGNISSLMTELATVRRALAQSVPASAVQITPAPAGDTPPPAVVILPPATTTGAHEAPEGTTP